MVFKMPVQASAKLSLYPSAHWSEQSSQLSSLGCGVLVTPLERLTRKRQTDREVARTIQIIPLCTLPKLTIFNILPGLFYLFLHTSTYTGAYFSELCESESCHVFLMPSYGSVDFLRIGMFLVTVQSWNPGNSAPKQHCYLFHLPHSHVASHPGDALS